MIISFNERQNYLQVIGTLANINDYRFNTDFLSGFFSFNRSLQ